MVAPFKIKSLNKKEQVMIHAERSSLSEELDRSETETNPKPLSDMVIPAVRGEYYAYSHEFTEERPLYVFMKCKANKGRPISSAEFLGPEANLLFMFGSQTEVRVCAIKTAHACGLLGSINGESFGETWIAPTEITMEDFYQIRSQKNVKEMVEICQTTRSKSVALLTLRADNIIAMTTDGGKYGLFLVKGITSTSIRIDACHILL